MTEQVKCTGCGEMVDEVCVGEMCRDCHVSITWESCLDNTWADPLYRRLGLTTPNERERKERGSPAHGKGEGT